MRQEQPTQTPPAGQEKSSLAPVHFTRGDDWTLFTFPFDRALVDRLKAKTTPADRRWDRTKRVWLVRGDALVVFRALLNKHFFLCPVCDHGRCSESP